jgi:hypothetical protein
VAVWDRLTALIAGGALSRSAGTALDPVFETTRQRAQHERAVKVLDPATAAELRAKETTTEVEGIDLQGVNLQDDSQRHGIGTNRFDLLTELARTYPGVGDLLNLVQRGQGGPDYRGISREHFDSTMRRRGFRAEDIDALYQLTVDLLSIETIANAVQQGHVPNAGILPSIDPTVSFPAGYEQPPAPDDDPPSHVPLTQIPIDPIDESTALGWDEDRLKVLANLGGLPPGPAEILQMWNRNLIDEATVDAGIREGHMKTKWAHAFKRMRWHVLSAPEYAGLWLRGWITKAQAIRGGALTGATPEQMDLLYKNRGRPMAPVQAFTAWARGAPHPVGEGIPDRPGTFDYQDFKAAIQRSDIRTEYVDPLWALRWAYPSLFQLRRAVQDGGISKARALTILGYQRYEDRDALALVNSWLAPTTAGAKGLTAAELTAEYEGHYLTEAEYVADLEDLGYSREQAIEKARVVDAKRVKKARDAVVARAGSEYVRHRINRAQAQTAIAAEGVPEPAQDLLLAEWDHERELTADALTAAQIKKAFRSDIMDRQTALDRLQRLGYDPGDDAIYLDE